MTTETRERAVANLNEALERLTSIEPQVRALLATSLYLYGSAARGELGPDSDVDVFVDYDSKGEFSFVELVRLEALIERVLGRPVDVGTRVGLHPSLRAGIEQSSIRVF